MSHPNLTCRLFAVALAGLAAAGCAVKGDSNGYLVLTKTVLPSGEIDATTGVCKNAAYAPGTAQSSFMTFAPAGASGASGVRLGLVIENRLTPNAQAEGGRLNTNDVVLERAVVRYELLEGGGPVPDELSTPLSGSIPAAGALATGAVLMSPAAAAAVANGSSIRFFVEVEGHTLDGAAINSNEFETTLTACNACSDVTASCVSG
jgi:hypothetical protein